MEKCNILFADNNVERILSNEFKMVTPRRNCIRKECSYFGKKLPKDIEIIENDTENKNLELGISINNIDIPNDLKPGQFKKFLKYNNNGSADFFVVSCGGNLSPSSKKFQNEANRVNKLLENSECRYCYIINNFELYGPEICKKNNLSYLFITYGNFGNATAITVMSSEGNLGKVDGKEIKDGCFKGMELNPKNISEKLEYLSTINFDVMIHLNYENPNVNYRNKYIGKSYKLYN